VHQPAVQQREVGLQAEEAVPLVDKLKPQVVAQQAQTHNLKMKF
jgi:hypothetical protein